MEGTGQLIATYVNTSLKKKWKRLKKLIALVCAIVMFTAMSVAANAEELVVMAGTAETDLAKTELIRVHEGDRIRLTGIPTSEIASYYADWRGEKT